MTKLHHLLAAAILMVTPALAGAESVEEKNLISGKAKFDPAMGYIYQSSPGRTYGVFLREPDDATRADYQADWDEAFAKAQKKYASALKRWESDVRLAQQMSKKAPDKPIEPTRETFSIGPILMRDMFGFGPMFVFSKSDTQFAYLNAVKPGTYIYYGPLLYAPGQPVGGYCYCMGTVRFEVKPGVITDLGNFLIAGSKAAPPYDYSTLMFMKQNEERAAKGKDTWVPPELKFGLPETLGKYPSARAEFQASGKLNNFFGVLVTRMPPIPGVLDYRRDTVIDARTGAEVASPLIVTQVRIKK